MPGAPKGNKNALKHGLYADKAEIITVEARSLRDPSFVIQRLETAIDEISERMKNASDDEFTRLANALSFAATALFNGHRTLTYLSGGMTPVEDAMRELLALDFAED